MRKIKKEFKCPKNFEDYFDKEIYIFESLILSKKDIYHFNSSELRNMLVVLLCTMLGMAETVNFDSFIKGDQYFLALDLLNAIIPTKDEAETYVKNLQIDANTLKMKILYFDVLLIIRIIDSIDTWKKRFGSDGYFTYLNNIGFPKIADYQATTFISEDFCKKLLKTHMIP